MANQFETMERLVRRRTRHLVFAEKTGELNIVPYLDIMVNLIMFMLVTITSSVSLSILGVSTPRISKNVQTQGPVEPPKDELRLTVLVSLKGFYVSVRGSYVNADGTTLAKGAPRPESPTLPKQAPGPEGYDFAGLTNVVAKLKEQNKKESRVILVADYRIQYDIIIKTMDALRVQAGKELFPDVFLGTL
jgi:biopolymer transport protein ExbD